MALTPWPTSPVALATALAELREALGEDANTTGSDDAIDTELKRQGSAVSARVEKYAASAPDSMRDEAVIRAIAYLRDTQGAERYGDLERDWNSTGTRCQWQLFHGFGGALAAITLED